MTRRRFAFHYEPLAVRAGAQRVFSDPKRQRRRRIRRHLVVALACLSLWVFTFFHYGQPQIPEIAARSGQTLLPLPLSPAGGSLTPQPVSSFAHPARCDDQTPPFAAMAQTGGGGGRVFAHLPVSMPWAHLSLARSCDVIDVLVPDWVTLTETADGLTVEVASEDTRAPVERYLAETSRPPEIMPRIQIAARAFDSQVARRLRADDMWSQTLGGLIAALFGLSAEGACLDFGQFPAAERAEVIEALRAELSAAGLRTCLIVDGHQADWPWEDTALLFDDVIVTMFYAPWVGSAPTPLSDNAVFQEIAARVRAKIGPERAVFALGAFGALWESGVPLPRRVSFGQAMAEVAGQEARLTFNAAASGSFAALRRADGGRASLWLQDAASAHNHMTLLRALGPFRLGVWSLGQEDPGIWPLIHAGQPAEDLNASPLTGVYIDSYVDYLGAGPALRVQSAARYGLRSFDVQPATGLIAQQRYDVMPRPARLERFAAPRPGEVLLTFDDGPHPDFTPQILEILAKTDTPAVFFALGQNVMKHPGILRDVFEAGHEVGTHSFSHPRMDKISDARLQLELTMTDRAVAGAIGHSTLLYREPFLRSGGPISAGRVGPLQRVEARGQINFGMDVVPKDWLGLSAEEIAAYAISQVEAGAGNVILLHDGGGEDRSASVAALPLIITELRDRGYRFVTAAETLGMSRATLMPEARGLQPTFDRVSFSFASGTLNTFLLLFWGVLLIGICRSGVILLLALRRRRHVAPQVAAHPSVTVVIPAYNEEAAIGKCIESVLASDYPWLEVVVVDDGSTDQTLNAVFSFAYEKRLRLISHPNQGKWSALNRALQDLESDIAVCIDADTQVTPDAISKMVAHFQSPRIGAVAGKIVVGNRVNLLTRMQALEYVTAQNFERRAFDSINGILVVPGAIGAWRVCALRAAGLFCADTMTEDCDMTISVNRAGYRVVFDERAVAFTEAPLSIRALMTQRLRWSLGMFQCAWKHRSAVRERRAVGWVSIPDMFVFGYLFPLLAPLADLAVLLLVYQLIVGSWSGDVGAAMPLVSPDLLWAYLALPVAEFAIAVCAILLDRTAPKSLIFIWPFQRLIYRPLLYVNVFRALMRALSGTLAVWGKSHRQGGDLLHLRGKA
ncbi:MAG: glycosyltransferase [Pseudomonadota bacterium]